MHARDLSVPIHGRAHFEGLRFPCLPNKELVKRALFLRADLPFPSGKIKDRVTFSRWHREEQGLEPSPLAPRPVPCLLPTSLVSRSHPVPCFKNMIDIRGGLGPCFSIVCILETTPGPQKEQVALPQKRVAFLALQFS